MNNAIEIRNLIKNYSRFTLGPIDLNVPKGSIYGLIGPNGAGKTTALDLIFGLGLNDAGTIKVLGLDHQRQSVEIKRQAAYVSPELNFSLWGKVGRAIRFVRGFYPDWDDAYCTHLMKEFHLSSGDKIATLSFGARTKLSLLLALSRHPKVLILDEPTTGLDAISKQQLFSELLKAVEGGERTVLISSHGLGDIERFTDHIGIINRGKLLLEGRTDEIVDRFRLAEFFTEFVTTIPQHEGFTLLERDGERWRALLDCQRGTAEWLQSRGVRQLTLTPMTLEDLFVALVREKELV
jgi:ABC-2 type transport system ATP-binding protein